MKLSLRFVAVLALAFAGLAGGASHWRVAKAPAARFAANPGKPPSRAEPIAIAPQVPPPTAAAEDDPEPVIEDSWAKELRQLRDLARINPELALARVGEMTELHERKAAATEVCLVVGDRDPAKAMLAAWNFNLGRFADDPSENRAIERLARRWAESDVANALIWASTLPADDEARRDRIVKGLATAIAKLTPETAARLVTERIAADSTVRIDATVEVLRQWARSNYRGALQWAAMFPEGALRERGLDELAASDGDAKGSP